jgi:hypothetical protein
MVAHHSAKLLTMLRLLLLLFALTLLPRLLAQGRAPGVRGPAPSELFAASAPLSVRLGPDTTHAAIPPTQWKRGLLIGGFAYLLCEDLRETDESCVGPGLGGAAVGAVTGGTIGALIGGQFHKRAASADSSASTPEAPRLTRACSRQAPPGLVLVNAICRWWFNGT